MKEVTTLQGLNLQSEISTTVIKIPKTEPVSELLELIKNFHPIFIDEYFFEENTLTIRSKLAFLWKELAETLIKLSKDSITYEEARKYAVEEIIKERIASMSTIPLLYSAYKEGFEVNPTLLRNDRVTYTKTFNRQYTIGAGKGSQIIYSISSSKDSKNAKEIQRDKWASNLMIEGLALPIPKWEILETEEEIEKIWETFEKPVVIKPTGLTGGSGVSTSINSVEQAKKAFNIAKQATSKHTGKTWQEKIMIQEQVDGEDYRLLVIDGKLEIVTKRIPAFVSGDGKSSIGQLITETNNDPRRDVLNPSHTLKPIKIDQPLLDFLEEQKISLEYVPKKDEKITVRKVASMSQGGITEDFTDKVSPEVKYIVESIASSIHAFVIGADILCKDISRPLTKDNGGILEINTMPEAYLNFYPVIGENREYVADTYIEKLLKGNITKRIVVLGQFTKDIPTLLRQRSLFKSYLSEEDTVGEYKEGDLLINSLKINDELDKEKAIESLKINASLDAIIIHHRNWQEVEDSGLGFDKIDMLVISQELSQEKEYFSIVRKYRRRGLIDKIKILK